MTKGNGSAPIYEVKITLKESKPTVWRRVHVRSDITLARLHEVIQIAMGWTDSHLHEFEIGGERYGNPQVVEDEDFGDRLLDEKRVRLDKVAAPKSRFVYRYDFGDNWEHEIKVEKAVPIQDGARVPHCVAGEYACPPEDCGGVWGYAEMLEKLADPLCEERTELIEWIGGEFDSQRFELQEVNETLRRLRE